MSDMNDNRKETDNTAEGRNLSEDELTASLNRELSEVLGQEAGKSDMPDDLFLDFQLWDEEKSEEDRNPESVQSEAEAAEKTGNTAESESADDTEGTAEESDVKTADDEEESAEVSDAKTADDKEESAEVSDAVTEDSAEETSGDDTDEGAVIAEETDIPDESVSRSEEVPAAEEVPKESGSSEIPAEQTDDPETAEADAEEAFDEADTDVLDVSEGVLANADVSTEELPGISFEVPNTENTSQSAAPTAAEPLQSAGAVQTKEDKKRRKQETAEAKKREKQEARERKKQEKAERKAKKKKGPLKIILMLLLLLVAAAAVVYLALSNRYKTVFFDGTKINGADCTGLTVQEAETVIARQMDEYNLTLVFRDGKKEKISGESIDFAFVPDGSVQDIKDSQIPVMWLTAFFQEYSYEATAATSCDTGKLDQAVTALDECNIVNMTAPEDAYINFNEEKKELEIVPENPGNKFDLSALIQAVRTAVLQGETELDVESLDIYEKPAVTSENEELIRQRDEMNDVLSASVTYILPTGAKKVLDASVLVTWLSRDEKGNYSVDTDLWGAHVASYVEDLAQEVNTSDSRVDFKTQSGSTVSLDNYLKGWIVDEEAEGAQLTEELAGRTVVEREPVYSQRAYSDQNNGIGNTYVEVDLSAQYLWAYDNGQVILETPIVSGTMVESTYTPEGIYPLYGKQAGRLLRGDQLADGSYEYASWVDYWMPFNGGIGLHDASWRTDFGGNIYVGAGSHGCVNMPSYKAAELFDWISTGTPVVCYYSAGYSLW